MMVEENGRRWFCVHTRRHMEKRSADNLGHQGFETFFPKYRKSVKYDRKKTIRKAPLFNGYIFVRFDPLKDRWKSANRTYGVNSLVMQGATPLPVPHGVVEELQAMADHEDCIGPRSDTVAVGDGTVIYGRHADRIKGVEKIDSHSRVRVLMDIIHIREPQEKSRACGG